MQEPQEHTPESSSRLAQRWRWLLGGGIALLAAAALIVALTANGGTPAASLTANTTGATTPAAEGGDAPVAPTSSATPSTSSSGSTPSSSKGATTGSTPATTSGSTGSGTTAGSKPATGSTTPSGSKPGTGSGQTPPSWVTAEQSSARGWTSGPCATSAITAHNPGINTTCQFAVDVRAAYMQNPSAGQYKVYADVPKFHLFSYFTMYCSRTNNDVVCWSTAHPKTDQNAVIWFTDTAAASG